MGTSRFDRDTALAPVDGGFEARIDPGWWIVRGPNGGYLAAILLRASMAVAGDADRAPVTLTTHYVRPPVEGPALVQAEVVRRGRSVTTVTSRMTQQGHLVAFATTALSTPRAGSLEFHDLRPPAVPPPGECGSFPPHDAVMRIPINDRYESRWALGDPPFSGGSRAESGGWMRTEDAREVDGLLVAALADGWVPALFSRLTERTTLVPTVEMTVYFRGPLPRPAGEYVLGVFRSRVAAGGYMEEDGELWSEDGVLLAQVRQLAVLVGA